MRLARFAPAAGWGLLACILCALFVRLGLWQWHRWAESDAAWTRFVRGAGAAQPLAARSPDEVTLYQRVSVTGRFDGQHQFLLDNLSYRGRPGYEVLTPFRRATGTTLLIDRGWVPFTGSRAHLPDVGLTDEASRTVSGRVAELPRAGLASGRAAPNPLDPWPRVTSFPAASELARALGAPLPARILLLDPGAPHGYVRDWQPPGMAPLRHLSYALQWWCFAALALIVWGVLTVRRSRSAAGPP